MATKYLKQTGGDVVEVVTVSTSSGSGDQDKIPSLDATGKLDSSFDPPAAALKSATTTVSISSATAPSSGQVLTATGSTAATWQTPSGGGGTGFTLYTGINNDTAVTTSSSTLFTASLPTAGLYRIKLVVRLRGTSGTGYQVITLSCAHSGLVETYGSWTRSRRNQTVDIGAAYGGPTMATSRGAAVGDVHGIEFHGHVVVSSSGSFTIAAQLDAGTGNILPGSYVQVYPETTSTTTYGFANLISITSGNGYAGSVFTSTNSGQWTADGSNISGQTGTTYTVTRDVEGKAIRCGTSNTIQMWTPLHVPTSFQTDGTYYGGWWDPSYAASVTLGNSSTTVASIANGFSGGPAMAQATSGQQPPYSSSSGGYIAFAGVNAKGLLATNVLNMHVIMCLQYKAGTETSFSAQNYIWGLASSGSPIRMLTQSGQSIIYSGSNAYYQEASVNCGLPAVYILPLPLSIFEFWSGKASPTSIGPQSSDGVSWDGPMREIVSLAAAPSNALRERLQGYIAWHNGIQSKLPADHPYAAAPPRVS